MKHKYFYYAKRCVIIIILLISFRLSAQDISYWTKSPEKFSVGPSSSIVDNYRSVYLDFNAVKFLLNGAISESLPNAFVNAPVILLPMPDGSFSKFRVALSTLMPDKLMNEFPMIRAFTAIGIDDPTASAQLDYTSWGFHAMILSQNDVIIIDPARLGNTSEYISFNRRDSRHSSAFICETTNDENENRIIQQNPITPLRSSGATLRTYRLAVAATAEYTAFFGGTVSGAMGGIVTSVNRVDGVYKNEVDVHMVLIANNSSIVYTNASTDPYTNGNGGTMLGQNQSNLDNVIGSANYDIGHVFSTGGGGVAYLGVPCTSSKAGGVTGSGSPVGDSFDIDYVAHEMGHQFGGNHSFNSTTGSCSGNRESSAAYEPGSGTTIMSYAGICGADNITPHSDAIFHSKNYDEIQDYITLGSGNNCPVQTSTGNTPPAITVSANYSIPLNTAFVLRGSATDINGDALTYLWEEYDLGPAGSPNSPSGNAPIFRDWVPVPDSFRVFPRMEDLVRNQQTLGEKLPTYARSLKFKMTVRDNHAGGGGLTNNGTPVTLTVVNTSTPFKVTVPNTNVTWAGGSTQTVTWDVSSTSASPISCANVKIMLSTDSGYSYPYTLLASTPNDGSQSVTLPGISSTRARIKVESIGNIFFDISNVNFTITTPAMLTTISTSALASNNLCAGSNVNVNFTIDAPANIGNVFTAYLSDASGSFSSSVAIGSLTSVNAGTIAATIPAGTTPGSAYRIRVISSNPFVVGTNNGANISISAPPATPGAISGPASVCQGQTGVVYSVAVIANSTSYVWTVPSGATITSGANTNTIVVNFGSSSGNITVRGTSTPCGNGPLSNPLAVTVNPTVGTNVNIVATPGNTICAGTSVTFTATPTNGGNTPSYQWKIGSTNVGSNNINFSSNSLANGNIVTCVMTSNATCAIPNPSTSNAISMNVTPAPAITSFTPASGGPGTLVVISGSTFTGATSVKFNGVTASFTVDNTGQITAGVPIGATTGLISVTTPCGTTNSSVNFSANSLVTLNVKMFLEGYYQPGSASGGLMNNGGSGGLLKILGYSSNPEDADTVIVSAMNASSYILVDSKKGILKTNGMASVTFSASVNATTSYYIKVNHRSALETWSSLAVNLSNIYDFTSNQSKAFGNNMIQTFDHIGWSFYSGDISNAGTGVVGVQDGVIESQDYSDMENAISQTLTGYRTEDITGDGVVESEDYSVEQNNVFFTRGMVRP